jgi:hypothetical protein
VVGESASFHAVFGVSHSVHNAGVFGANDHGFGVIGTSEQGVGISGKGGRLAGLFEGNVEITESLTLRGIDVVGLLRRLQSLEAIFAELEAARAARSIISVQQGGPIEGGAVRLRVTGEHFRAFATIRIDVASSTSAGALNIVNTDGAGKIDIFIGLQCSVGTVLSIAAFDEVTQQISNTVKITCN